MRLILGIWLALAALIYSLAPGATTSLTLTGAGKAPAAGQTQLVIGVGNAITDATTNATAFYNAQGAPVNTTQATSTCGVGACAGPHLYVGADAGSGNTYTITGFKYYGPSDGCPDANCARATDFTLWCLTSAPSWSGTDYGGTNTFSSLGVAGAANTVISQLSGITACTARYVILQLNNAFNQKFVSQLLLYQG